MRNGRPPRHTWDGREGRWFDNLTDWVFVIWVIVAIVAVLVVNL